MNGTYVLLDETATDKDRVWKHPSESVYVTYSTSYDVWTITSDIQSKGMNFTDELDALDPYNADGSSLQWMLGAGRSGGTVTKE